MNYGIKEIYMNERNELNLMPAIFIGHGSPMNILQDNSFTRYLKSLSEKWPRPRQILIISAHWLTNGVEINATSSPRTIHDFYGFPEELYKIQYQAPGDLALAKKVNSLLSQYKAKLDNDWGFDHGTWSLLSHIYPEANIPTVVLSLNRAFMNLRDHFELAHKLKELRNEGVLIVGSGNIVHNLRLINYKQDAPVDQWAYEFDEYIKKGIIARDEKVILGEDEIHGQLWKKAHPSLEHYLPLLYVLGVANTNEKITFPYEKFEHGNLSMRSVQVG